jgi:hypothetical protein
LIVVLSFFAAAVLTGCRGDSGQFLVIKGADSRKVYGRWQMPEAGEFAVEFIHSVNQSPVMETFKVEKKRIYIQSVRFSSLGAGMLNGLDEGLQMVKDGDQIIIYGFDVSFEELNYIVGTVSDHLLLINGTEVSLRDLCGRNAHITISVK